MVGIVTSSTSGFDTGKGFLEVNYDFSGLNKKSKEFISLFGNFRFEFGETARSFAKYDNEQFNLKGNGKYKPLSPRYAASKYKKYGALPILVLSGRLRDSLTSPGGNSDSVLNISNMAMERGTKVPYAEPIQKGAPKRNLPARPFYFVDNQREEIVQRIFDAGVNRRVDQLNSLTDKV